MVETDVAATRLASVEPSVVFEVITEEFGERERDGFAVSGDRTRPFGRICSVGGGRLRIAGDDRIGAFDLKTQTAGRMARPFVWQATNDA